MTQDAAVVGGPGSGGDRSSGLSGGLGGGIPGGDHAGRGGHREQGGPGQPGGAAGEGAGKNLGPGSGGQRGGQRQPGGAAGHGAGKNLGPGSGGHKGGPTTPPPGHPGPGEGTGDQNNAFAQIEATLTAYGLGSLASWAWGEITAGKDSDQVVLDLYKTPEFKQRFPAIFTRQQQGLPPLSPGDYVSYENTATQIMREAGLPAGFWDSPSDFTALLSNDVSTDELQQRVQLASQAANTVPDSVRTVLQRDYGINTGDLAANFLDAKQALPVLQQKFLASQIGGAADITGYGSNKGMDDYLAQLGVSFTGAQAGFTDLGQKHELFQALPGEAGNSISRDDQVSAEFGGNAAAQQAITLAAQKRQAAFSEGGGYQSSSSGFGGVGGSTTT